MHLRYLTEVKITIPVLDKQACVGGFLLFSPHISKMKDKHNVHFIRCWCGKVCVRNRTYFELKILIVKLVAIDALSTGAVVVGEVAPLDHEIFDDCT